MSKTRHLNDNWRRQEANAESNQADINSDTEAAGEVAFVMEQSRRLGFMGRALRWDGEKPQTGRLVLT